MASTTADQKALEAVLRNDLSSFIQKTFDSMSPGGDYKHNWHIDAIAHRLQQVLDGEITRLIITMPPRSLKSIATSVAFAAFALGHEPTTQIINACYSDDLAAMHARHRRQVMKSKWYTRIFPKTRIGKSKDSETEFVTTANGGCYATSVGGTLTGRGADIIIIDDAIKVGEAASEAVRHQVNSWYRETLYTRLNDKESSAIIIVMQRVHEDDLVGHVLDLDDWTVLDLPAIATEFERIPIGRDVWVERRPDDVLHPEREDRDTLESIKRIIGSYAFEAQYQQNPLPPEGNMIKQAWFKRYKGDLPRDLFAQIVQSWDTATETGAATSFSVGTTWGVRENRYDLLHVLRERMDFPTLKSRVASHAHTSGADTILIEKAGSGHALLQSLYSETDLPVIAISPQFDKETRVAQVSAQIEAGRVHLPEEAPWLAEFEKEVLAFPNGKFDDQVDSLSQFLRWSQYHQPPELEVRITTTRRGGTYYDRMGGSFP